MFGFSIWAVTRTSAALGDLRIFVTGALFSPSIPLATGPIWPESAKIWVRGKLIFLGERLGRNKKGGLN